MKTLDKILAEQRKARGWPDKTEVATDKPLVVVDAEKASRKPKAADESISVQCPECHAIFSVDVPEPDNTDDSDNEGFRTDPETAETGGDDRDNANDDDDQFDDVAARVTKKVLASLKGKIKPTK